MAKKSNSPSSLILYIENPKDSTPRLLELIQQFGSVAEYKINAQKSVAFLYGINETEEREIKESIPFPIAPKSIRSFTSLVRLIPRYLLLLDVIVNGIDSLISLSSV